MNRARALLLVGALMAALVLFWAPLKVVFSRAGSLLDQHGIALLPSLITLAVVLLLYGRIRQAERQELAAVHAAKLDTATAQAEAQAAELTALVRFSQRLNLCTDVEALRQAVLSDLPRLIGEPHFWLTTRVNDYDFIVSPAAGSEASLAQTGAPEAWETFPLMAGDKPIGVLGLRQRLTSLPDSRRRTIELAALLLAASIKNVQMFTRIRDFSMFDPLTGCLTKLQGMDMLSAEMRRAHRSGSSLCVVMLDLDHFKALNDQHGHVVGDQALARLGRVLKRDLRASDTRCRYGGAEFLLVLPETPLAGALQAADDLRQRIREIGVVAEGERVSLSASLGIAEVLRGDASALEPLSRARSALNTAKAQGRNRVVAAKPLGSSPGPAGEAVEV